MCLLKGIDIVKLMCIMSDSIRDIRYPFYKKQDCRNYKTFGGKQEYGDNNEARTSRVYFTKIGKPANKYKANRTALLRPVH